MRISRRPPHFNQEEPVVPQSKDCSKTQGQNKGHGQAVGNRLMKPIGISEKEAGDEIQVRRQGSGGHQAI